MNLLSRSASSSPYPDVHPISYRKTRLLEVSSFTSHNSSPCEMHRESGLYPAAVCGLPLIEDPPTGPCRIVEALVEKCEQAHIVNGSERSDLGTEPRPPASSPRRDVQTRPISLRGSGVKNSAVRRLLA